LGDFSSASMAWFGLIPAFAIAIAAAWFAVVMRRRLRLAERRSTANEGLAHAMSAALGTHAMGVIALPHGTHGVHDARSSGSATPGAATMVALPGLHKLFGLAEDGPLGFNEI